MPQRRESRAEQSANIFGDGLAKLPSPVFHDRKHHLKIFQGDCLEILARVPEDCVDLIFADPPYFLSNNGITCHAGKMVSVNKGEWDRSRGEYGLGSVPWDWMRVASALLFGLAVRMHPELFIRTWCKIPVVPGGS